MNLISMRRLLLSTAIVSSFAAAALAATINGGEGDDNLRGTPSRDVINAKGGDDRVYGEDGDDFVLGGLGGGILDGGPGSDIVISAALTSGTYGQPAEIPQNGVLTMNGGDGNDYLIVGLTLLPGSSINCGPGDDIVNFNRSVPLGESRTPEQYAYIQQCETWLINAVDGSVANHPANEELPSIGYRLQAGGLNDHSTNVVLVESNVAGLSKKLTVSGISYYDRIIDASAVLTRGVIFRPVHINGGGNVPWDARGSQADDEYYGTVFPDTFTGNSGNDLMVGDEGDDIFTLSGNSADYTIAELTYNTFTVTDNRTGSPDGTDTIIDVNKLQFADQTVDVVIRGMYIVGDDTDEQFSGGGDSDFLDGAGGNDSIAGGGGNDTEVGGSGDDNMEGGPGNDFVYGDEQPDLTTTSKISNAATSVGSDTINYSKAKAAITVNLKTGKANSTAPNDPAKIGIDTLKGIENIRASLFDDTLRGSSANNLIDGGKGRDIVIMSGKKRQYTVTYNTKKKTYLVVDKVAGRDGTDTLKNVEVIRFTDGDQVTMSLSSSASTD